MIERTNIGGVGPSGNQRRTQRPQNPGQDFGAIMQQTVLQKQQEQSVNFSKHAQQRVEERGIELTPDLMERLAGATEKAQEKGAVNILAFGAEQAFIINVPQSRVITTMTSAEMREKVFTNIDAAVLL